MSIITVDKGLVMGVTEGSTTTMATSTSGVSSESVSVNVAKGFVLEMCGGELNNSDPSNATGVCLKIATDADNNWFTSTPSIAVMEALGYSQKSGSDNIGDTYASTYIESESYGPADGEFARFTQQGLNSEGVQVVEPGDGDDANAGVDGQYDRWCKKLNTLGFGGKTTWRRPTRTELENFYQGYEDAGAGMGLWSARGWPVPPLLVVDSHWFELPQRAPLHWQCCQLQPEQRGLRVLRLNKFLAFNV